MMSQLDKMTEGEAEQADNPIPIHGRAHFIGGDNLQNL